MHVCTPPEVAPKGRWTCECGERWFVGLADGTTHAHVCGFPGVVASVGHTVQCSCGARYYALYIENQLTWRKIGA